METYIDRIKQLKAQKKMTNDQLASRSGIPLGTLSKLLAGMSDSPKLSNIVAICNALDCSVEYIVSGAMENTNNYTLSHEEMEMMSQYRLLDFHGRALVSLVIEKEAERMAMQAGAVDAEPEPQKKTARILTPVGASSGRYAGERIRLGGKRQIQLYELPVSAGVGMYLEDSLVESISIPRTEKTEDADYALRISGNSMEPKYHDGDILLIEQTDTVEVGELGIFLLDGSAFFKSYGGDRLYSLNADYGPILLKDYADIQCKGRVIGRLKRK